MKSRTSITLALCAFALALCASPLSAGTLEGLFATAVKSNQDFSVYRLNLELAGLKQTKGEIEAKIEQERTQAKYEYSISVASYWGNVQDFYNKVVNAIFDARSAEISYQSYSLTLQNAQENLNSAEVRYKNGIISEDAYKEFAISYSTAQTNLQVALFKLDDAKAYVKFVTGLEWNADLLPDTPAFSAKATLEEWVAKDFSLEQARLNQKINSLKTDALATNTSMYDRRIQETENAKAATEVANAENNAKRSYEKSQSTLANDEVLLKIRQDEYALKLSIYQQAQEQYKKGTISLSSENEKQIDVYSAQANLLSAQKDYINATAAYQIAMRENPLGL